MVQIYGTLGPACKEQSIQEQMFRAGLTGMRLNLSHTGLKDSAEIVHNFMQAARTVGVPAQLLIDMQGPELRVGVLKEALELKCNETVILSVEIIDKSIFHAQIPVPPSVINALVSHDEVLLNDGKLSLRVEKVFDAIVKILGE